VGLRHQTLGRDRFAHLHNIFLIKFEDRGRNSWQILCNFNCCFRRKQSKGKFNYGILIGIVIAVLFFLILLGLVLWKCRKNRRQSQQTNTSVSYKPLQGYRQRLLDEYPKYVLPENYEVEINQRKKPE
jgi:hypothetical protein